MEGINKNLPKKGDTIVVWFSCGAASAIAAKETLRMYGGICKVRIVNNPVEDEDPDNKRFLRDCEKWLGKEIEFATNPKFPTNSCVDVWSKHKFMSSPYGAPCTMELKKNARKVWEANNHHDFLVLGFTSEEENRFKRFRMTERENILDVLISQGISKPDCFLRIMEAGIDLPAIYKRGYPNANCIGCVKAASPTYWNHVREQDPLIFKERADQSRELGAKLVSCHPKYLPFCKQVGKFWYDTRTGECLTQEGEGKKGKTYKTSNVRIHLDDLPEGLKTRPMKGLDFECGIFCEERV